MATHSSTLAWKIPWMEEPGGLPSLGLPPGFSVHHQLPEFIQTHVHLVGDAIQPSILCLHLLLPP